ncbi:MAG: flagellar basal body rod protein FlgB [Bacillota bacterium]
MSSFINFLNSGLTGSAERQKAISENIANVDTPRYQRRDVDFQKVLREKLDGKDSLEMSVTDKRHLLRGAPGGTGDMKPARTNFRNDGNNVDVDVEMAELSKNNIYYNTLLQRAKDRFGMLNEVIRSGGE